MLSVDRHPAPHQLRSFGVLLAIFVPLAGALIWWRTGRLEAGTRVWIGGAMLTTVYGIVPPFRRLIYVGWMYAAFPIGWSI